jgi:hypothetical protein
MIGVTYSLRTKLWETREYNHTLTSAIYCFSNVYYSSADAHVWTEEIGVAEGCDAGLIATCIGGSQPGATTTINTLETLGDYVGANVVFEIGGVYYSRIITTCGGNTMNVAPPLPSVPLNIVGFIGGIQVRLTSEWRTYPDLVKLTSPVYILVSFEPAQANLQHQMSYAINFGAYQTWTQGPSDTPPSGLYWNPGDNEVQIAGNGGAGLGFVSIPIDTTYMRTIKWHFESYAPVSPFGLLEIKVSDRNAARQTPGIGE